MVSRNVEKTVYPVKDYQCEYENVDGQRNKLMRRLDLNYVEFHKQAPRKVGEGFGGYMRPKRDILELSTCNE
jgi:hypothetical protein